MANLATKYLGLEIKNPLIASSSALSKKLENIKKMEDAGLGAVVLYSLFEEEISHESKALNHFLTRHEDSFWESVTFYPDLGNYNVGPEKYLKLIQDAKESVEIPVIASLNGISTGGWIEYARLIQGAGADALEINMYFLSTDSDIDAQELEDAQVELVRDIRKSIKIPLAVKLSPFYTSIPNFAQKLAGAGANGLVLFNRFYQPDLDVEELEVMPKLILSNSNDMLLPLRWIAIMHGRVDTQFAITSGVHSAEDIAKAIMAGSNAVMTASELAQNGIAAAEKMTAGFADWMDEHEYESVDQMRGSLSQKAVEFPAAFERANYMKALISFDNQILYIK